MRAASIVGICRSRFALGCLAIGLAVGCRSPQGPPPEPGGGLIAYRDSLSPEQERTAKIHALFAQAVHHTHADEFAEAAELYRQALALSPTNEVLVVRLADTMRVLHQNDEALALVEHFVEKNPAAETAMFWLALFYKQANETSRGIELLRRLTRLHPTLPAGWLQLASLTARENDTNAVESILREGITKAKPPTPLRRQLLRLELIRYVGAKDDGERKASRERAVELLNQIIAAVPGDFEALAALGELLTEANDYKAASEIFETLTRRQPAVTENWEKLAGLYLLLGERERAIATLEQVAHKLDLPPDAHYSLGNLYRDAKDYTNAAVQYKQAAEASPHTPQMWVMWALMYSESEPDKTFEILNRALELNPKSAQIMEITAALYQQNAKFAEAAKWLQKLHELVESEQATEPPSQYFYFNFALVCTHLRRTEEAAQWLQQAVEQDPAFLPAYVQESFGATASYRQRALQVLRALAKRPTTFSAEAHLHLGNMYAFLERNKAAVAEYDKVLAIVAADPLQEGILNAQFYFWYGVVLDETGQTERAIPMFERCLEKDSSFANAHNYLAYTWAVRNERLDEALRHIQIALAMEPENAAFLDTLGWVYFKQGQYADALKLLEKANELRPHDPEIEDHLTQTREKLAAPAGK